MGERHDRWPCGEVRTLEEERSREKGGKGGERVVMRNSIRGGGGGGQTQGRQRQRHKEIVKTEKAGEED